ncbi:conserved hypothetical protein [Trichinella spiralis]|uniref:hypothetical protein n=1 Tax=Trichinella spiralis TaxID=6334 RepID=UPI0001EFF014|nr:conserved hypothetical protein [Trichinella spiralis]
MPSVVPDRLCFPPDCILLLARFVSDFYNKNQLYTKNSPVSLFLLNHRRKTASTYRRTCATAVGTDDQTPCQDSLPPEDVRANSNLILADLIRELAALWNHADQLVNDLYIQLKQLDQGDDQAKSRIGHLHKICRTLQHRPMMQGCTQKEMKIFKKFIQ